MLRKGEKGQILQICSKGELGRRIRDMGLVPGVPVMLLGRAPMGDPLALRVADTTVALRKREAAAILIKK
ncbi:FeoA family protein [uncultured Desulfovibrio sp.]|uniref:FeoA family protein n=1 Tax=uncultured Desulfovibrio sp. TaxID=167968 RepID=UPI00345A6D69